MTATAPQQAGAHSLQRLPESMRDTIVAVQDANFYQHHGVDWQALHDALRANIRAGRMVQDGGTISMELVHSVLSPRSLTLPQQLAEIFLALQLEGRLTKDQILDLYVNRADFGLGTHGINEAAQAYFDRKPEDLSLGEIAFLAGVLAHPPSTREQVSVSFIERSQNRALDRLHRVLPLKYPADAVQRAVRARLAFAWERGGLLGKRSVP